MRVRVTATHRLLMFTPDGGVYLCEPGESFELPDDVGRLPPGIEVEAPPVAPTPKASPKKGDD